MNTNRREMLPYGYVTFDGRAMNNFTVDSYNRIQRDINTWIDAGREVPEYLLFGSHNIMASHLAGGR